MSEIVIHTLRRFKEVLDSLECECHDGFTCTIHNDKRLVESALKIMEKEDSKSKLLIHYCDDDSHLLAWGGVGTRPARTTSFHYEPLGDGGTNRSYHQ